MYVIRCPELYRKLAIKEFDSFEDHKFLLNPDVEPLFGNTVFLLRGQKWREMRATLSPAFTGSKMRLMFDFVRGSAEKMQTHLLGLMNAYEKNVATLPLEMSDVFSRYANDAIANCAYGFDINSFTDKNNDFFLNGKKLGNTSWKTMARFLLQHVAPGLAKWLGIGYFDAELREFFTDMIVQNMTTRRQQGIVRHDMVDLLLRTQGGVNTQPDEAESTDIKDGFATANESNIGRAKVHREWTETELIAQTFIFYVAGFDTTAALLVEVAYELMLDAQVQQKLIDEIDACRLELNGKPLTYERLQKLTYLDMVISEALRIRPPGAFVDRLCTKDISIPIDEQRTVEIKRGEQIWVPISAYHHDEQHFPNPDKFDPERFNDVNRLDINPAWYLPFGAGPRNCIGSRFALMVAKTMLYHLLSDFRLEPNSETQIPMKMNTIITGMYPEKGLHMNLCLRRK